jgi:hypothetical protein
MAATFPLSFRNDTLRKHRRNILFEREKALLPAMQVFVGYWKNVRKYEEEISQIRTVYGDPAIITPTTEQAETLSWRFKVLKNEYISIKNQRIVLKTALENETDATKITNFRTRRRELKKRLEEIEEPYRVLKEEWLTKTAELNTAIRNMWQNKQLYDGSEAGPARREFVMKCADENCRGFLSSAYKCGTCEKWTCPDCLLIIGPEKDAEHTCNPDTVETAKAIKAETRPCPKCGTRISKIDGCFAKDTPVLTWNGQVKLSQDIVIGDTLIGDDGMPRTVEALCSGEDAMFQIEQNDGISYTVNSKHTLVLKFSGHKKVYWSEDAWKIRWFTSDYKMKSKTIRVSDSLTKEDALAQINVFKELISEVDTFEITVEDYLKLADSTKKNLMGFKAEEIHWKKQEVRLDPYMLGLYLGDGVNTGMAFAVCFEKDPEVLAYLLKWCEDHDSEVVHDATYLFRIRRRGSALGRLAISRGASSANCKGCSEKVCMACDTPNKPYDAEVLKGEKHHLKEVFASYNLIKNKHIPKEFLLNDRESRLRLLAGLIDTDGCATNDGKRIMIPQANHALLNQIEFLARSLGFITHVDTIKKKNISFPEVPPRDYPDQLRLCISGTKLSEIPTLIPRKKGIDSSPNRDWLRTSIRVTPVGTGAYYGWSVNGNKRFLLKDTTVLRNCDQMFCVMEGCHTAFSWNTGHIVTGKIHNPHYYEWLKRTGGGIDRETGDIPCGGLPHAHQIFDTIRNSDIPNNVKNTLYSTHRALNELIEYRLQEFPARPAALANKDLNVRYLMNLVTEDEWKRQLELAEAKFQRRKEIGQILQTIATAGSDAMNQIVNEFRRERGEVFAVWLSTTAMEELERLRLFGNESLKALAKRDRIAVPQFGSYWGWIPLRAIYKPAKPANAAKAAETNA